MISGVLLSAESMTASRTDCCWPSDSWRNSLVRGCRFSSAISHEFCDRQPWAVEYHGAFKPETDRFRREPFEECRRVRFGEDVHALNCLQRLDRGSVLAINAIEQLGNRKFLGEGAGARHLQSAPAHRFDDNVVSLGRVAILVELQGYVQIAQGGAQGDIGFMTKSSAFHAYPRAQLPTFLQCFPPLLPEVVKDEASTFSESLYPV